MFLTISNRDDNKSNSTNRSLYGLLQLFKCMLLVQDNHENVDEDF